MEIKGEKKRETFWVLVLKLTWIIAEKVIKNAQMSWQQELGGDKKKKIKRENRNWKLENKIEIVAKALAGQWYQCPA